MRKKTIIAATLAAITLTTGCAVMHSDYVPRQSYAAEEHEYIDMPVSSIPFTYSRSNWKHTRREAMAQFRAWADRAGLGRQASRVSFTKITLKEEACYIEYSFKVLGGPEKYIYMCIPDYRVMP